jgi:hypothetical protein
MFIENVFCTSQSQNLRHALQWGILSNRDSRKRKSALQAFLRIFDFFYRQRSILCEQRVFNSVTSAAGRATMKFLTEERKLLTLEEFNMR